jgi:hypothetical protein
VLIFNLDEFYSNITGTLTATKVKLSIVDITRALINKEGRRLGSSDKGEKDVKDVTYYTHAQKTFMCFKCGNVRYMVRNC